MKMITKAYLQKSIGMLLAASMLLGSVPVRVQAEDTGMTPDNIYIQEPSVDGGYYIDDSEKEDNYYPESESDDMGYTDEEDIDEDYTDEEDTDEDYPYENAPDTDAETSNVVWRSIGGRVIAYVQRYNEGTALTLPGAEVSLVDAQGLVESIFTNELGEFYFGIMPFDVNALSEWHVAVTLDGFESKERTLTEFIEYFITGDINASEHIDVNFKLEKTEVIGIAPLSTFRPAEIPAGITVTIDVTNETELRNALDLTSDRAIRLMNDINITGAEMRVQGTVHVYSNSAVPFAITRTAGAARILNIASGTAHLHTVTLTRPAGAENTANGGGVLVSGAHLHLHDGSTISHARHNAGGGINITSGALTMHGGTIRNNRAINTLQGDGGGGVRMAAAANITFNMYGGLIYDNWSGNTGGGVQLSGGIGTSPNLFNMRGGTISFNHANQVGGGVHVNNYGRFAEMSGNSLIYRNTAPTAGGVRLFRNVGSNNHHFRMYDNASIIGNIATMGSGGGISLQLGSFSLTTDASWMGSISDNAAALSGGGIHMQGNNGTLTLNGNGSLSENEANNGGAIFTHTGNLPTGEASAWLNVGSGITFAYNVARSGIRIDENLEWRNRANVTPRSGSASVRWLGVNPSPLDIEWREHLFNNYDINVNQTGQTVARVSFAVEGTASASSIMAPARVVQVARPAGVTGGDAVLAPPGGFIALASGDLVLNSVGTNPTLIVHEVISHPWNADIIGWSLNGSERQFPGETVIGVPLAIPADSGNSNHVVVTINYRYPAQNRALTINYQARNTPIGMTVTLDGTVVASNTAASLTTRTIYGIGALSLYAGTVQNQTFLGWMSAATLAALPTNTNGQQFVPGFTTEANRTHTFTMPAHAVTMIAVWGSQSGVVSSYNDFSITYNANGGINPPAPREGLSAGTHSLTAPSAMTHSDIIVNGEPRPVRFMGWSLTRTNEIFAASDRDSWPELVTAVNISNQDITVYAVWKFVNILVDADYGDNGEIEITINVPDDEYEIIVDEDRITVIIRDTDEDDVTVGLPNPDWNYNKNQDGNNVVITITPPPGYFLEEDEDGDGNTIIVVYHNVIFNAGVHGTFAAGEQTTLRLRRATVLGSSHVPNVTYSQARPQTGWTPRNPVGHEVLATITFTAVFLGPITVEGRYSPDGNEVLVNVNLPSDGYSVDVNNGRIVVTVNNAVEDDINVLLPSPSWRYEKRQDGNNVIITMIPPANSGYELERQPDGTITIHITVRFNAGTHGTFTGLSQQQTLRVLRGTTLSSAVIPTVTPNNANRPHIGWSPSNPNNHVVLAAITFTATFAAPQPAPPSSTAPRASFPGASIRPLDSGDDDAYGMSGLHMHQAFLVGFEDGTIRPRDFASRAQVATIFFRLMSDDARAAAWSTNNQFPDVQSNDWFNNAVSTTANGNIFIGTPDGTFEPNRTITRAEFSAAVVRFMGIIPQNSAAMFSDIDGHWASAYLNTAASYGLLVGVEGIGGRFIPDQEITRAEVAAIIVRILGPMPESHEDMLENMLTWTDNADVGVWYYMYIQEATNSHYFVMNADGVHKTWIELAPARDWRALEMPNALIGNFI